MTIDEKILFTISLNFEGLHLQIYQSHLVVDLFENNRLNAIRRLYKL